MVRRNILANAVGGSVAILLNLLVTPFLIRILGAEAYGLLGLIASLQVMFGVLDLGLSTTIVREIAGDVSPGHESSRSLVQTMATIYWLVAALLGGGLFLGSGWVVEHWLHLQSLSPTEARFGIQILALSIGLRWPVAFYGGVITGLQDLARFNAIKIISAVVRLGGGLGVLLVRRDLTVYLWWIAFSALLEVALYAYSCFRVLPGLPASPKLDMRGLSCIWRFSLSMNMISVLSLVFTQADRVLISRLRPLSELGYYSLAVNVVMSLSVIQGFITSAVLPAMAADYSAGHFARLSERYAKATETLIFVITLPACVFIFFGYDVLRAWVSVEAAHRSYIVLAIFSTGFLLNASVSIAYTMAVASGHTRIPLTVNIAAVVLYVPGLVFTITRWGIVGAASSWLALNLYYLFTLLPLVQVQVVKASVAGWISHQFAPFVVRGAIVFGTASAVTHLIWSGGGTVAAALMCALACATYALWSCFSLRDSLRHDIVEMALRLRPTT